MHAYKKIIVVLVVVLLLAIPFFSYKPKQAEAFSPGVIVVNKAKWVWERISDIFATSREAISANLAERALDMYMSNLAYEVATELAEGGPGGKPQFRTLSISKSLKNSQDAAFGEFLGELSSKGFDELGINLCDPSLEIKLSLTLSLIDSQEPPRPKCNWSNVKDNWKQFGGNLSNDLVKFQLDTNQGPTSTREFFRGLGEESALGQYMKLIAELNERKREDLTATQLTAQECQGFIDKSTTISKETKIHCQQIKNLSDEQWQAAVAASTAKKGAAADKKSDSINFGRIMRDAGSQFLNTFSSKLLRQWIKKGTWSLFGSRDDDDRYSRDNLIEQLRGGGDIRQPRNRDIFRGLKTIEINKLEDYSILEDFVVCPQQKDFRKPDNCVVSAEMFEAIISSKTIAQGIAEGLIDGNISLVGKDDILRNNSDDCYNEAFCYSNLVKLRKANIVPIGWELAALRSSVTSPVTLQQAIDCFEDAPESNCSYAVDSQYAVDGVDRNPFYHLIDDAWVLKAPKAFCEAFVYSSVLESSETSNRQQYCADFKTCIREDENGNCIDGQYSYCTNTENIWRFNGAICEDGDIYSGCLTFNNSDVGNANYIEGSLDYCSFDQAGCKRYVTTKNNSDEWVVDPINVDVNDIYLNNSAKGCAGDDAGCHEFIVMAADRGINLVPNGSFTNLDGDSSILFPNGRPDGWIDIATGVDGDGADYDGDRLLNGYSLSGITLPTEFIYQEIQLLPNTTYRLTASAAQDTAGGIARILVNMCDSTGNCQANSLTQSIPGGGDCVISALRPNNVELSFTPAGATMERSSCTFTTNSEEFSASRLFVAAANSANMIWFDNIELEIVSATNVAASTFSEYGDGGRINMTDDRFMCTAQEVGCQGYIPRNGDPLVPAVISPADLCPAECVGYANYAESSTLFDQMEGASAVTPIAYHNFILDTAEQCPLSEVGCEEMTNLDEVAQGGEGKEYFTFARQCVAEDLGITYYTWEGSDIDGYQLKTWLILESNFGGAPINAPCSNLQTGGTNTCIDTAANQAVCDPNGVDAGDPNCREFFDLDGVAHPRWQQFVIFASTECHDYRRTISGEIYKIIPSLSDSCQPKNNNCRSYLGNTSNNIREIFFDEFESGTYDPWTPLVGNIDLSTEALANNGHSLKSLNGGQIIRRFTVPITNSQEYEISWWMKNKIFLNQVQPIVVAFDAGGAFVAQQDLSVLQASKISNISGGKWNYYKLSHHLNNAAFDNPNITEWGIIFLYNFAGITDDVFMDNIVLREVTDSVSVIKNSWQTPVSCDTPFTGYYLGCEEYSDTNGTQFNLKSFDQLCRVGAIGCSGALDTFNSDNPFEQIFNAGDLAEVVIPKDEKVYLVPDPSNYCSSQFQGCQALGLEDRDDSSIVDTVYKINEPDNYNNILCDNAGLGCEAWDSAKGTYYFKDPKLVTCTYQENVNINDVLYSGWFQTSTLDQTPPIGCSDGLLVGGVIDPSPGSFNSVHDLELADDIVASCPANKNLCTTFRDPSDPINCDVSITTGFCSDPIHTDESACTGNGEIWTFACQQYYYYDNGKIDESSCNGQIDRGNGCVLFSEANNWNADHTQVVEFYDSVQTYDRRVRENRPVSPTACDPTFDPLCKLDSNRIIKVNNDRQCSQWLSCKSSAAVWDEQNNTFKTICDSLDLCLEYDDSNNITQCKKWAAQPLTVEPLSINKYQQRATGPNDHLQWSDDDFTGYSIPNNIPIQELTSYAFDNSGQIESRAVYPYAPNVGQSGNNIYSGCLDAFNNPLDGQACNPTIGLYEFTGECQEGVCWVGPQIGDVPTSTYSLATRGYAVADAPFPEAITPAGGTDRLQAYASANICEDDAGTIDGCENIYQKVTYGVTGGSRYYPPNFKAVNKDGDLVGIPGGICVQGNPDRIKDPLFDCNKNSPSPDRKINSLCNSPAEPDSNDASILVGINDGVCELQTAVETFYNWGGVCLEQDLSTPLVTEGSTRYACNQWYPVSKISGTNSLFDNYREAGYYNTDGLDVQFCSLASPYTLTEERIYCGKVVNGTCRELLVVPEGAKINTSAIINNEGALTKGFLKQTLIPIFQRINYDAVSNPEVEWDRIEKKDISQRVFNVGDFVLGDALAIPVNTTAQLAEFYDANIEKFFWDDFKRAQAPNGRFFKKWECDKNLRPWEWMQINGFWCNASEHEVWKTAYYGGDKCKRLGPRQHFGEVSCNPLTYHYYIKIDLPDSVECSSTNCSSGLTPLKGIQCIFTPGSEFMRYYNNGTYVAPFAGALGGFCSISGNSCDTKADCPNPATEACRDFPWPKSVSLLTSEGQCKGDINCEYAFCIWDLIANSNNSFLHDDIDPLTAAPLVNVTWCSDFGEIIQTEIRNLFNRESSIDVTAIAGCSAKLLQIDQEYDGVRTVGVANHRSNANPDIIKEMFGNAQLGIPGCVVNEDDGIAPSELADCRAVPDFWSTVVGTPCTGLDCYQQCSIVAELDAEGDNSWVRTDIWWRNELTGNRVASPAWVSYFYDGTKGTYVDPPTAAVTYNNIFNPSYVFPKGKPFGQPAGSASQGLVVTEAPLGMDAFGTLTASTFWENATSTFIHASSTTEVDLSVLFARIYRRVWQQSCSDGVSPDRITCQAASETWTAAYAPGKGKTISGFRLDPNPEAGGDYAPRVLQVCGEDTCELGNVVQRGVTINNENTGSVEGRESLFVAMKFFFYAHPDHMPLTFVDVDWDDGPAGFVVNPGKYKNSIPSCDSEALMPIGEGKQGFGGLPRACREGYKVLYHDYQYDVTGNHDCVGPGPLASCYYPEVRVVDRWGGTTIEPFAGEVKIYKN